MQNLEHTGWKLQRTIAGGALELAGGIGMIDPLALALDMDDGMIEVAIRSLELVLPSEKGQDEW